VQVASLVPWREYGCCVRFPTFCSANGALRRVETSEGLLTDLAEFTQDHHPHGPLTADAREPAWNRLQPDVGSAAPSSRAYLQHHPDSALAAATEGRTKSVMIAEARAVASSLALLDAGRFTLMCSYAPTSVTHESPGGQLSERGTRAFFPPPIVYGRSTTSDTPVSSVVGSPILSCIGRTRIWTPSGVFPGVAVAIKWSRGSPGCNTSKYRYRGGWRS